MTTIETRPADVRIATIPTWATGRQNEEDGICFTRDSDTRVTDTAQRGAEPQPATLQQAIHMNVENGYVITQLEEPVIRIDVEEVTLDGARDLIRALLELLGPYDGHRIIEEGASLDEALGSLDTKAPQVTR